MLVLLRYQLAVVISRACSTSVSVLIIGVCSTSVSVGNENDTEFPWQQVLLPMSFGHWYFTLPESDFRPLGSQ